MSAAVSCMVFEPGAGVQIDLGLGCPTVKVGGPLSGEVGVVEGELPPGGGFQVPHWHEDLDEVIYVLEGEIEFLLDGHGDAWDRAARSSSRLAACMPFATPATGPRASSSSVPPRSLS